MEHLGRSGRWWSRWLARYMVMVGCAAIGQVLVAPPAGAHGVTVPGGLPFPTWQLVWSGVATIAVAWSLLALIWQRPRLGRLASGRPLPVGSGRAVGLLRGVGAAVGMVAWLLTVMIALAGAPDRATNVSPLIVTLVFWVGTTLICAAVGDLWSVLDPVRTCARLLDRSSSSLVGAGPAQAPVSLPARTSTAARTSSAARTSTVTRPAPPWLAAFGLTAFLWLELASPWASSPRVWGMALLLYPLVMVAWSRRRGGAQWLSQAESFAVFFSAVAACGVLARRDDGVLIARPPLTGLCAGGVVSGAPGAVDSANLVPRSGVVIVALGAALFDGLSRTSWWVSGLASHGGAERTLANSAGLIGAIALVAVIWVTLATLGTAERAAVVAGVPRVRRLVWRARVSVAVVVPLTVAWIAAHNVGLFVFDGQNLIVQLSDPLSRGWDLFGTINWSINYQVLSAGVLVRVQLAVVVCSHFAALLVAHERALTSNDPRAGLRRHFGLPIFVAASIAAALLLLVGS